MKNKTDANSKAVNFDRFEPGGHLVAIANKSEYGARLNLLPDGEREIARETWRFADLCQYFDVTHIDIPSEFLEQLGRGACLPVALRIQAMKGLNQRLMEYLANVGEDSGFRQ